MRNPMDDFNIIRENLESIVANEAKTLLFYELSRSIAKTEDFILQDKLDNDFKDSLSQVIVDTISLLSSVYKIEDLFNFLESRRHWGDITEKDNFEDHFNSLVKPFYQLRCDISHYIINKGQQGFKVKPLFNLAKFLIYLEEESEA